MNCQKAKKRKKVGGGPGPVGGGCQVGCERRVEVIVRIPKSRGWVRMDVKGELK